MFVALADKVKNWSDKYKPSNLEMVEILDTDDGTIEKYTWADVNAMADTIDIEGLGWTAAGGYRYIKYCPIYRVLKGKITVSKDSISNIRYVIFNRFPQIRTTKEHDFVLKTVRTNVEVLRISLGVSFSISDLAIKWVRCFGEYCRVLFYFPLKYADTNYSNDVYVDAIFDKRGFIGVYEVRQGDFNGKIDIADNFQIPKGLRARIEMLG